MGAIIYLITSPLFWALFVLAAIFGAGLHKVFGSRKKKPKIPTIHPSADASASVEAAAHHAQNTLKPVYSRYASGSDDTLAYTPAVKKKH